jgi:hypothetical protein
VTAKLIPIPHTVLSEQESAIISDTARRDWAPVVDALSTGKSLFLRNEDIRENDIKYLQMLFGRNRDEWGLRFHSRKALRKGEHGRILWAENLRQTNGSK